MRAPKAVLLVMGLVTLNFESPAPARATPHGRICFIRGDLGSAHGSVNLLDLASGRVKKLRDSYASPDESVVPSPDGKLIALATTNHQAESDETLIIDLQGRVIRRLHGRCTDWSSDGKELIGLGYTTDKKGVRLFITDITGANRRYLQTLSRRNIPINFSPPKFSPSGQVIIFEGYVGKAVENPGWEHTALWTIEPSGGNSRVVFKQDVTFGHKIDWMDDHSVIVKLWGGFGNGLVLLDIASGKFTMSFTVDEHYGYEDGSYCRQGNQVVCLGSWPYYRWDCDRVFLCKLEGLSIKESIALTAEYTEQEAGGRVELFAFSPDGNQIAWLTPATQDQTNLVVFDLVTRQKIAVYNNMSRSIWSMVWIP